MEVNITMHGILRDYLPRAAKGRTTLTLPPNTTIQDIVAQFNIKQTISAAVNGAEVETSTILQDGDDLQMFRLIAGG